MLHIPAVVLGQVFALGVCRKIARRITSSGEALAIVLAVQSRLSPTHGSSLAHAVSEQFFLPALLTKGTRFLSKLVRRKRTIALIPASDSGSPRAKGRGKKQQGTLLPTLPPPLPAADALAMSTSETAERYSEWIELAKQMLAAKDIVLPSTYDVDGLEVCRFVIAAGIRQATNERGATLVLAKAVPAIKDQLQWWSTFRFCSPEELEAWSDVMWWDTPDENGHMCLVLHATRAVTRLSGAHGSSDACVRALVSQIELGVRHPATPTAGPMLMRRHASHNTISDVPIRLLVGESGQLQQQGSNEASKQLPDRIVVRVVCAGANSRQVLRLLPLLRRTAQLMVAAYPNRLKRLHLVDLPPTLWVSVKTVLMLIKRETRDKVQVTKASKGPHKSDAQTAVAAAAGSGLLQTASGMERFWHHASSEALGVAGASVLFVAWVRALLVLLTAAALVLMALRSMMP